MYFVSIIIFVILYNILKPIVNLRNDFSDWLNAKLSGRNIFVDHNYNMRNTDTLMLYDINTEVEKHYKEAVIYTQKKNERNKNQAIKNGEEAYKYYVIEDNVKDKEKYHKDTSKYCSTFPYFYWIDTKTQEKLLLRKYGEYLLFMDFDTGMYIKEAEISKDNIPDILYIYNYIDYTRKEAQEIMEKHNKSLVDGTYYKRHAIKGKIPNCVIFDTLWKHNELSLWSYKKYKLDNLEKRGENKNG